MNRIVRAIVLFSFGGLVLAFAFSFASVIQAPILFPQAGTVAFAPLLLWAFVRLHRRRLCRKHNGFRCYFLSYIRWHLWQSWCKYLRSDSETSLCCL